ncbi:hypothetical protein TB1_018000 [Malus domestica]
MVHKDLLGSLLDFKDEKGETLTHNQIVDNIIGVMFAAQDTTASLLITWMIKYIHDDSKLQETIEAMKESLRMASIISFTCREAVEDVEYKGRHNDHPFNSFTKGPTSNINTALLYLNLSSSKM